MDKLTSAFKDFDQSKQPQSPIIAGEIGITIGNRKRTEVPNRGQFVYVRLRSDLSEVIQAFNDKVFPGYGLPVLVSWKNNRYEIIGRDVQRYPEWEADNPYLARHGSTHSLDKDGNHIGTDPVWIYPYQFIPSLVSPFNINGVQNAYIHPYLMNYKDTWKYTGNTGTPSLVAYKPTSGSSIILIAIDGQTGNPALFATTGTYIPDSVTGSVELSAYLPNIDRGRYVPLSFAVMQSGTTSVSWSNLYDARQFYEVLPELQVNSLTDVTNIQFSGVNFSSTGTVAFIEAIGSGASTGTAYPIILDIEGTLETGTSFSQPYLVTNNYTINNVYLYCENLGITGTTIVDVNKNGVSLFTGTAGLTLPYNSTGSWVKLPPYYSSLVAGDVITVDIVQRALGVSNAKVAITSSNAGGDASLAVEQYGGSVLVSNVEKIVIDGGTVHSLGGNSAKITIPLSSGRVYLAANSWSTRSGTWGYVSNQDWFYNISNAVGNYLEFDVYLNAGTYDFYASFPKQTDRGIVDLRIDGVSIGTLDQYGADSPSNQGKISGFTITNSGYKKFKYYISGKNVSSSAYYVLFRDMVLVQTS